MTAGTEAPKPRSKWPLRRVHKWMSVSIGVILFMWLVTGLIIILPSQRLGREALPPLDFSAMTIAPAQAAGIGSAARDSGAIESVGMRRLGNRLVYTVWPRRGPMVLVDATSGDVVTITEEIARAAAVEGLPGSPTVTSITRIEAHTMSYQGALPAWRAEINDGRGTRAYVNGLTGEVQRNPYGNRLKGFISSFHGFGPLRDVAGDPVRHGALWVTSIITIAVVLTGYWMALPKRKRREG